MANDKMHDADKINIEILRIKDVYFYLNERLYINDPDKQISIEMTPFLTFKKPENVVSITVKILYHYVNTEVTQESILVDVNVQTVFRIEGLERFIIEEGELKLPSDVISALTNLSISHARALVAKNLLGTPFQFTIMPIVNAGDVAKTFFPNMFVDQEQAV